MSLIQTGQWPRGKKWKEVVAAAAAALRKRYNRSIGATPKELLSSRKMQAKQRTHEWNRAGFESPLEYTSEETRLEKGGSIKDGAQAFALGDYVLPGLPKKVRLHVRAKESDLHYDLLPLKIVNIFHARKPRLYQLWDPRTRRKRKRLFYAVEMKKVHLPVHGDIITDARVTKGKLEYKTHSGAWVPCL